MPQASHAPAAWLASAGRWPIIMDMAENYPAMIADIWTDQRQGPFDVLVRNPGIVSAVERFILPRLSHVITVIEESRERLLQLGLPPNRVSVVSNTPSVNRLGPLRSRIPGDALRIVYLGLMEKHRGVSVVLDAVRVLKEGPMPIRVASPVGTIAMVAA